MGLSYVTIPKPTLENHVRECSGETLGPLKSARAPLGRGCLDIGWPCSLCWREGP